MPKVDYTARALALVSTAANRTEMAKAYSGALQHSVKIDWRTVNKAILKRWSKSGLGTIKTLAWKMLEQRRKDREEFL